MFLFIPNFLPYLITVVGALALFAIQKAIEKSYDIPKKKYIIVSVAVIILVSIAINEAYEKRKADNISYYEKKSAMWQEQMKSKPAQSATFSHPAENNKNLPVVITRVVPQQIKSSSSICATCNGTGHILNNATCNYCLGQGHQICTYCAGKGSIACRYCRGEGFSPCKYCRGEGKTNCNSCRGAGVVNCTLCKGLGNIMQKAGNISIPIPCIGCSGKGKVNCKTCSGKGGTTCNQCKGAAKINCTYCLAKGSSTCNQCSGTGKNRQICFYCNGTGVSKNQTRLVCTTCNGLGKLNN